MSYIDNFKVPIDVLFVEGLVHRKAAIMFARPWPYKTTCVLQFRASQTFYISL